MIIAIDFDGTIVDHEFPGIGKLKPNVKEVINRLHNEGHTIIIWTCRTTQKEPTEESTIFCAKEFLDRWGIKFHTINNNDPRNSFQPAPKIYADVYIDDRNLGGIPEDWEDIYKIINKNRGT